MKLTAISSSIIRPGDDLVKIIFKRVAKLQERSIFCISSKVVALAEGSVVAKVTGEHAEKHALVAKVADRYLPARHSKYDVMLTIKHNVLAVNAGIDESNVDGVYALWPKDPMRSAEFYWHALREHYKLSELGIVITDSKTTPLRWGVMGTCIGHCGFLALNNRMGESDIFGRKLQMTQENLAEGFAAAATVEMGEGNDTKPFVVIEAVPRTTFRNRPPSKTEIAGLSISLEDDVYAPLLTAVPWEFQKKQ